MQTPLAANQPANSALAGSGRIIRNCVHCGFCTATCPTYALLGDELDSPRGRIYLIKGMLEGGGKPDANTVRHLDRCLSCLACMTTCPSGVNYMHLIDHARAYVEQNYKRPVADRALRWMFALVLPNPTLFRLAIIAGVMVRPIARFLPQRLRAAIALAPRTLPRPSANDRPQVFHAEGHRRLRVALMTGCAQRALNTDINDATIRVLTRHGCEVVVAEGAGCCGALTHHMGKEKQSHKFAERNVRAWASEMDGEGLDAVVINTSGCGTTVKDYGYMFKNHAIAKDAERVSKIAKDVVEVLQQLDLRPVEIGEDIKIAYHAACSLQHGQQIKALPKALLTRTGFKVTEPKEAHLCCGSAGTYNLTQPEISSRLKERKVANLQNTNADIIAAGNIGCMIQIGSGTDVPIVHTVELVDWATGGPRPPALGTLRQNDCARHSTDQR